MMELFLRTVVAVVVVSGIIVLSILTGVVV